MAEKTLEYRGDGLVVRYDVHRCIHAAECVRGLPDVFDPQRKPWIEPDAASADAVAETIEQCPTGALSYERLDGGGPEVAAPVNAAQIVADGPLYLRGELVLERESGDSQVYKRIALCRCGASRHKPFCDGSHTQAGFEDAGQLAAGKTKATEAAGSGAVSLRCRKDGPVVFKGTTQIRSADGQTDERSEGALCRCGGSSQKPFCDGTHLKIGFTSD